MAEQVQSEINRDEEKGESQIAMAAGKEEATTASPNTPSPSQQNIEVPASQPADRTPASPNPQLQPGAEQTSNTDTDSDGSSLFALPIRPAAHERPTLSLGIAQSRGDELEAALRTSGFLGKTVRESDFEKSGSRGDEVETAEGFGDPWGNVRRERVVGMAESRGDEMGFGSGFGSGKGRGKGKGKGRNLEDGASEAQKSADTACQPTDLSGEAPQHVPVEGKGETDSDSSDASLFVIPRRKAASSPPAKQERPTLGMTQSRGDELEAASRSSGLQWGTVRETYKGMTQSRGGEIETAEYNSGFGGATVTRKSFGMVESGGGNLGFGSGFGSGRGKERDLEDGASETQKSADAASQPTDLSDEALQHVPDEPKGEIDSDSSDASLFVIPRRKPASSPPAKQERPSLGMTQSRGHELEAQGRSGFGNFMRNSFGMAESRGEDLGFVSGFGSSGNGKGRGLEEEEVEEREDEDEGKPWPFGRLVEGEGGAMERILRERSEAVLRERERMRETDEAMRLGQQQMAMATSRVVKFDRFGFGARESEAERQRKMDEMRREQETFNMEMASSREVEFERFGFGARESKEKTQREMYEMRRAEERLDMGIGEELGSGAERGLLVGEETNDEAEEKEWPFGELEEGVDATRTRPVNTHEQEKESMRQMDFQKPGGLGIAPSRGAEVEIGARLTGVVKTGMTRSRGKEIERGGRERREVDEWAAWERRSDKKEKRRGEDEDDDNRNVPTPRAKYSPSPEAVERMRRWKERARESPTTRQQYGRFTIACGPGLASGAPHGFNREGDSRFTNYGFGFGMGRDKRSEKDDGVNLMVEDDETGSTSSGMEEEAKDMETPILPASPEHDPQRKAAAARLPPELAQKMAKFHASRQKPTPITPYGITQSREQPIRRTSGFGAAASSAPQESRDEINRSEGKRREGTETGSAPTVAEKMAQSRRPRQTKIMFGGMAQSRETDFAHLSGFGTETSSALQEARSGISHGEECEFDGTAKAQANNREDIASRTAGPGTGDASELNDSKSNAPVRLFSRWEDRQQTGMETISPPTRPQRISRLHHRQTSSFNGVAESREKHFAHRMGFGAASHQRTGLPGEHGDPYPVAMRWQRGKLGMTRSTEISPMAATGFGRSKESRVHVHAPAEKGPSGGRYRFEEDSEEEVDAEEKMEDSGPSVDAKKEDETISAGTRREHIGFLVPFKGMAESRETPVYQRPGGEKSADREEYEKWKAKEEEEIERVKRELDTKVVPRYQSSFTRRRPARGEERNAPTQSADLENAEKEGSSSETQAATPSEPSEERSFEDVWAELCTAKGWDANDLAKKKIYEELITKLGDRFEASTGIQAPQTRKISAAAGMTQSREPEANWERASYGSAASRGDVGGSASGFGTSFSEPAIRVTARMSKRCERCRKGKLECDSVRPSCGRCERLGGHCVYPGTNPYASYGASLSTEDEEEKEIGRLRWDNEVLAALPYEKPGPVCKRCESEKLDCDGSPPCTPCRTSRVRCVWSGFPRSGNYYAMSPSREDAEEPVDGFGRSQYLATATDWTAGMKDKEQFLKDEMERHETVLERLKMRGSTDSREMALRRGYEAEKEHLERLKREERQARTEQGLVVESAPEGQQDNSRGAARGKDPTSAAQERGSASSREAALRREYEEEKARHERFQREMDFLTRVHESQQKSEGDSVGKEHLEDNNDGFRSQSTLGTTGAEKVAVRGVREVTGEDANVPQEDDDDDEVEANLEGLVLRTKVKVPEAMIQAMESGEEWRGFA